MNRIKLDKKDTYRVLLTDTSTDDVPIIFSNDGLYINRHSYSLGHASTKDIVVKSFFDKILLSGESQSSPYKYSIRKNNLSLRGLSLIHPRSQLNFAKFYEKYSDVIIYLCSISQASIRAPYKISNSYFSSDSNSSSKYKNIDIDTLENELSRKHAGSYFSYRGHNRLYKLFNSNEYTSLEKKYSSFWMIDIANCFDSIYTHSISWAIKNKEYVKKNVSYRNQFCNEFDQLIQRSNNNETNGIPIGAEVSRIFAEIIFQAIDISAIAEIYKIYGYTYGNQYSFHRYVDDYSVFSESEEISSHIAKAISDTLSNYNLYVNEGKLKKYTRPFNTEKSNIITQTKKKILDFEEKIFDASEVDGKRIVRPKKINRKDALIRYFIGQIKHVCSVDSRGYSDISSYLISTLSNRIIEIISGYRTKIEEIDDEEKLRYRDAITTLVQLMFFFYIVYPQVSSSYKLSKTIIIIDRFFKLNCPEFSDHFRTLVMKEIEDISFKTGIDSERSTFIALEELNILLATSEFGRNYLVPEERLNLLFNGSSEPSYFSLISILYYIAEHENYTDFRKKIENAVLDKIDKCIGIKKDSELSHLFLDSLSCPYLSQHCRKKILNSYLATEEPAMQLNALQIDRSLAKLQDIYWFVKWRDMDLIKLLERKELNSSY
jgi:hypothetical protein